MALTGMADFAGLLRRSGYEGRIVAMAATAELECWDEIFFVCIRHGYDC